MNNKKYIYAVFFLFTAIIQSCAIDKKINVELLPIAKFGSSYSIKARFSTVPTYCDFLKVNITPKNVSLNAEAINPKHWCNEIVISGIPKVKGEVYISVTYRETWRVSFHQNTHNKIYKIKVE